MSTNIRSVALGRVLPQVIPALAIGLALLNPSEMSGVEQNISSGLSRLSVTHYVRKRPAFVDGTTSYPAVDEDYYYNVSPTTYNAYESYSHQGVWFYVTQPLGQSTTIFNDQWNSSVVALRFLPAASPAWALDSRVTVTGGRIVTARSPAAGVSASVGIVTVPWSDFQSGTLSPAHVSSAGHAAAKGATNLGSASSNSTISLSAAQVAPLVTQLKASPYDGVKLAVSISQTPGAGQSYGFYADSFYLYLTTSAVPEFTTPATATFQSATATTYIYSLAAAAIDPDDSTIGAVSLAWSLTSNNATVSFSGSTATISNPTGGDIVLRCTATDRDGLKATSDVTLVPPAPPTAKDNTFNAGRQLSYTVQLEGVSGPTGAAIKSYVIDLYSLGLMPVSPGTNTTGTFTLTRNNNGPMGDQLRYHVVDNNNISSASALVRIVYADPDALFASTQTFSPLFGVPGSFGGVPQNPSQLSPDPIRYATGDIVMNEDDLDPVGQGLGHRRSYSCRFTEAWSRHGAGWTVDQLPSVLQSGTSLIVCLSGSSSLVFAAQAQADGTHSTSSIYPAILRDSGDNLALADPDGGVMFFYGFGTAVDSRLRGQIRQQQTPGGVLLKVAYNASGQASLITRLLNGVPLEEVAYGYSTDGQILNVERRAIAANGDRTVIRRGEYQYYSGAVGEFGDLGMLRSVSVTDGATVLRRFHYRYWRSGSSLGPKGAMRMAFGPRNMARMSAQGIDPLLAADTTVAPYADKYFEYADASDPLRVTKQTMLGSEVDASGTFNYAYAASGFADGHNAWKTRTTETNPDSSQNIVYTNYRGEVLLKIRRESASATTLWLEAFKYDSAGRILGHATPAALNGYAEAKADLVGWGETGGFVNDTAGLINWRRYATTTTATATVAGSVAGRIEADETSLGEAAAQPRILQRSYTYLSHASK